MRRFLSFVTMLALAAAATPSAATEPCANSFEERRQLRAEKAHIAATISDLAMGGAAKRKPKLKGDQVGQAVIGTASSVLLPFGVGAVLGLGMSAARASARKKAAPAPAGGPDAEALLARETEIDRRLGLIELECGAEPGR